MHFNTIFRKFFIYFFSFFFLLFFSIQKYVDYESTILYQRFVNFTELFANVINHLVIRNSNEDLTQIWVKDGNEMLRKFLGEKKEKRKEKVSNNVTAMVLVQIE